MQSTPLILPEAVQMSWRDALLLNAWAPGFFAFTFFLYALGLARANRRYR